MSKELNIAIAGLGTVGSGVFKILAEKKDLLEKSCGRKINVTAVSARDKKRDRGINLSRCKWYDNPLELALCKDIDIIVESIGGEDGVAYELCKNALNNNKHVVTANKAMIAKHGLELTRIAEKNNIALMFEPAVAGGIPIIKLVKEGLAANNIKKISGILNGTCNYILTAMQNENREFSDVLLEAQEKGYAETPPDLDIDGIDTAHKLAILSSIAYGAKLDFARVYIEGIREISLTDIKYASELGYKIRLLGIADKVDDNKIEQRVYPALIPNSSPLARVEGVLNGMLINCDSVGEIFITGAGAGGEATGSAAVADIIEIAKNKFSSPLRFPVKNLTEMQYTSIDNHVGEYYFRITVKDKPGVLASITSLFSSEGVGVESILQKSKEKIAQIALITHKANEIEIRKILKNINEKDYIIEKPNLIRVERI